MRFYSAREIDPFNEKYLVFKSAEDHSNCADLCEDTVELFLHHKSSDAVFEYFSTSILRKLDSRLPNLNNEEVSYVLTEIEKFIGEQVNVLNSNNA